MKTFRYRAYDGRGRRRRGLVEAESPKEARALLLARDLSPVSVDTLEAARESGRSGGMTRAGDRAMVYRELSAMLRAGLPMVRALEMLLATPELAACHPALAEWRDRVREGAGPAEALEALQAAGAFERAAVEAGQRAGAMGEVMDRLADFLEEQETVRGRVLSALVYPSIVAALAVAAAVGMLGFMLPHFARVWTEARVELPPSPGPCSPPAGPWRPPSRGSAWRVWERGGPRGGPHPNASGSGRRAWVASRCCAARASRCWCSGSRARWR